MAAGTGAAVGLAIFPLPDSPYLNLPPECSSSSQGALPAHNHQGAPTRGLHMLRITAKEEGGGAAVKCETSPSVPSVGRGGAKRSAREEQEDEMLLKDSTWLQNVFRCREEEWLMEGGGGWERQEGPSSSSSAFHHALSDAPSEPPPPNT